MKINNKLIIYKTLQAYEDAYQGEKIKDDSIVFVIEDHTIRTHGKVFGDGANHQKGFFESVDKLPENALDGDLAIVYEDGKWYVYIYHSSTGWVKCGEYGMPNLIDKELNSESTNSVENRVITEQFDQVTRELSAKVDINNYRNDKLNISDTITNIINKISEIELVLNTLAAGDAYLTVGLPSGELPLDGSTPVTILVESNTSWTVK